MDADEVAVLEIDGAMIDEEQRFDAKLGRLDSLPLRSSPKRAEVLPGKHVIDVAWAQWALAPGSKRSWVLVNEGVERIEFEALEGAVYGMVWDGDKPALRRRRPAAGTP